MGCTDDTTETRENDDGGGEKPRLRSLVSPPSLTTAPTAEQRRNGVHFKLSPLCLCPSYSSPSSRIHFPPNNGPTLESNACLEELEVADEWSSSGNTRGSVCVRGVVEQVRPTDFITYLPSLK